MRSGSKERLDYVRTESLREVYLRLSDMTGSVVKVSNALSDYNDNFGQDKFVKHLRKELWEVQEIIEDLKEDFEDEVERLGMDRKVFYKTRR